MRYHCSSKYCHERESHRSGAKAPGVQGIHYKLEPTAEGPCSELQSLHQDNSQLLYKVGRPDALCLASRLTPVHRRIDLLNADLRLQNDFDEAQSTKKSKKKASSRSKRKSKSTENGYHFIAYVPVNDEVWELDGLEYKPLCLGKPPCVRS